jgi:hypothetical protein
MNIQIIYAVKRFVKEKMLIPENASERHITQRYLEDAMDHLARGAVLK